MQFRAGVGVEYQTDGGRYLSETQATKSQRIFITRAASSYSLYFFFYLFFSSRPRVSHLHRYGDLSLARRISHGDALEKFMRSILRMQKRGARDSILEVSPRSREIFAMIQRGQSRNASVRNAWQAVRE